MSESKWFCGVEWSIILFIFLWRHVQKQWAYDIWHSLFQRLWRPAFGTFMKYKGQKSNAHCSWTCLQRKINKIIDPSTPQNHLLSDISMWDTLYLVISELAIWSMFCWIPFFHISNLRIDLISEKKIKGWLVFVQRTETPRTQSTLVIILLITKCYCYLDTR